MATNNNTYPPGFYAAPAIEKGVHCFDYNNNPVPEMNFNDYVYFYSHNVRLTLNVVEWEILRKIVANQKEVQHLMDKMMMVNKQGKISLAHLPVIVDVVAKPAIQAAIRELERHDVVEYEGTTTIIPKLLVDKIDPKPIIPSSGPIYAIGTDHGFNVEFSCYPDQVVFLRVRYAISNLNFSVYSDMFIETDLHSRYQAIRISVDQENDEKNLDTGAAVVLWNGRRVTRPSFKKHFRKIVRTHKPILIILTELGATSTNCERVFLKLGTKMSWKFDAGGGSLGGTAVFWDPNRVEQPCSLRSLLTFHSV